MGAHRRTIVVAVSAVAGLATGMLSVLLASDHVGPATTTSPPATATEPFAQEVLRAWDRRRSRAYARADPPALAALYDARSRAGALDLAALRGYRDRGLRVVGMRTQVLSVRLLRAGEDRLVVLVTDALADAVVTDATGRRWPLPHDRPSTARVVLERVGERWRVRESYALD